MISSRALLWQGNNARLPTGPLLCCWCQRKSVAEQGCTIASVVPARPLGSMELGQQAGLSMACGYQWTLVRQPEPGHAATGCYYFAVRIRGMIHADTPPPTCFPALLHQFGGPWANQRCDHTSGVMGTAWGPSKRRVSQLIPSFYYF